MELRALVVFPEYTGSIPSTTGQATNRLQFQVTGHPPLACRGTEHKRVQRYTFRQNSHTYKIEKQRKKLLRSDKQDKLTESESIGTRA